MPERSDPAPRSPGGSPAERVEALVRAECVRALFERSGIAQAATLLNACVVVAVLWTHVAPARLLGWAALVWLVAAGRLSLAVRYRRAGPPPADADRWARRFTVGAALNGVAWGAVPLLAAGAPLTHLIFLAFVLGGMVAGAALSSASVHAAFVAFTAPALLPMLVLLLAGGDRLRLGMGLLLASFALAVSAISRTGGRTLTEAVRFRFGNAELASELAAANAELEARVVERSAQLEAAAAREREAERQLASAARLATAGTLAAGIAHEINNPLTYLRSNLKYVREELSRLGVAASDEAALDEALADATEGAERVRRIVQHLMALSRFESREAGPLDVHAVLDVCVDMAGREIQPKARVVREYGEIPRVLGDRIRLEQVFLNLLLNAAHAVPAGDPGHHEIRLATRLAPDGWRVMVSVSDTGCGIPEASLERIWAPFFTTRSGEHALGLGLPICRSIVGALGGKIGVVSREGAGSTFTVWLRAAEHGDATSQPELATRTEP